METMSEGMYWPVDEEDWNLRLVFYVTIHQYPLIKASSTMLQSRIPPDKDNTRKRIPLIPPKDIKENASYEM